MLHEKERPIDRESSLTKETVQIQESVLKKNSLEEKETPLIQVENLKKYYPVKGGIITHTTGYVKAVDGVSFSVMKGQTLGLVGESGCGKSTIGRQLVGLEKPTEGKIYYNGRDLVQIQKDKKEMGRIRTKLQMVFQDPYSSLNPRKHIYEILAQPMLYHHISSKGTVERDILKILNMVGLPKTVLGRYPHEFSGGQRQRIGIAKALSLNPEFIVCDEPVSALDVSIQAQILNLLKELQKELGLTLLFVGHGLGAVNYVSDQIAVMYLGKIVEYGNAREIFNNPVHPYTRALLEAVPLPDPREKKKGRRLLQGEIGSSTNPPMGCRFHTRCPYAMEACAQEAPFLENIDCGTEQEVPSSEKAEIDSGFTAKESVKAIRAAQQIPMIKNQQCADESARLIGKNIHMVACPAVTAGMKEAANG